MANQHPLLKRPREYRIPWADGEFMNVRLDPVGFIAFREPYARRWLTFPLSRCFVLAADAAASSPDGRKRPRTGDRPGARPGTRGRKNPAL